MTNYFLSTKQKKVRKKWMIMIFCFPFLYRVLELLGSVFVLSNNVALSPTILFKSGWDISAALITFWIFYHCSYKKFGLKLITFWLIVIPLKQLPEISEIAISVFNNDWILNTLLIANISLLVIFYTILLKIRKDNLLIQSQAFTTSEKYSESLSTIRAAKNLVDLQHKFQEVMKNIPRKFSFVILPHYEEMQKSLSEEGSN
ncbi:MAG: hypothetical protein P0S96_07475 [Simkaniaceae bacterium]|nr:hypothetical protein [Candidatus Sacchlamyda saccharinae]